MDMDELVTIKVYSYQYELAVIRGRLEVEGIESFVQDELIVQTNPLYSNLVGGIKLQVRHKDVEISLRILQEVGHSDTHSISDEIFLAKFEKHQKTSWFKNISSAYGLLIFATLIIGSIVTAIYYITKPSIYEMLTERTWCVKTVRYLNKNFRPYTNAYITFSGPGFCEETIRFNAKNKIELPGFNTESIIGRWDYQNDSVRISNCNNFDYLYNGLFYADFINGGLILKSSTTEIICYSYSAELRSQFYGTNR